jgi:formyltetrahydrofolate hydrolase
MNKVAILIGGNGRGTNMKSLAQSCFDKRVDASIALVIAPKENEATEWARFFDIPVEILPKSEDYAEALLKIIIAHQIDIVCLAGYTEKHYRTSSMSNSQHSSVSVAKIRRQRHVWYECSSSRLRRERN